jgi:hypothetical protein
MNCVSILKLRIGTDQIMAFQTYTVVTARLFFGTAREWAPYVAIVVSYIMVATRTAKSTFHHTGLDLSHWHL